MTEVIEKTAKKVPSFTISPIKHPHGLPAVQKSNSQRLANYPFVAILENDFAFSHFIQYAKDSHALENLFFWCSALAFRECEEPKGWESRRPRTLSFITQQSKDVKESQVRGASYLQVKVLREAYAIYDRFIAQDAPSWVCLPPAMITKIETVLEAAQRAKKGKMETVPYTLFLEAERFAYQNLVHDILPRYLKALVQEKNYAMIEYLRTQQLALRLTVPDMSNHAPEAYPKCLLSTNIILSALYPSPQGILEARPDSGIRSPISKEVLQSTLAEMSKIAREDRGVSIMIDDE